MRIILFIAIVGCSIEPHTPKRKRDKQLESYFAFFDQYYNVNSNNISSEILDFTDNTRIGYCITYSNGFQKIEISKYFWNKASALAKEALIFHELGHCSLNKEHDDSTIFVKKGNIEIEVPASIMNTYSIGGSWYYEEYREQYLEQLKD